MDNTKLNEKLNADDVEVKKLVFVLEPLNEASKKLTTYNDVYAVKLLAEKALESANIILEKI